MGEAQRQQAKEQAVLIALQKGMALIRRDLEIYALRADNTTTFISRSTSYDDLWQDALTALQAGSESTAWTTDQYLHEVVITAIVVKDGKYLITKRVPTKKRFPNMWTVPGGKLETSDYTSLPKDTTDYWYNVLEKTLKREVKEEVGLDVTNVEYVTSLATVHADGAPSLVISCMAEYAGGEVTLQPEETDEFAWVSLEEAKNYDLIDGIYDELSMVEHKRNGVRTEWKRAQE